MGVYVKLRQQSNPSHHHCALGAAKRTQEIFMTSLTANTAAGIGSPEHSLSAQKDVAEQDRALVAEMKSLFHTVDRFILLMRVYPTGHPLVDTFNEQFHERLQRLAKREGYVFFKLAATELQTEAGEVCFTKQESEHESFLWYPASADGIVSVQIDPEVTPHETMRFIHVLNRVELNRVPPDDDTVTLLWEEDFQHIHIHAVESFSGMEDMDIFGAYNPREVKGFVLDACIHPGQASQAKLDSIFEVSAQGTVLSGFGAQLRPAVAAKSMPPEVLANAFRMDLGWVSALQQEWSRGDDLEYRFIEALLSIVRAQPNSPQSANALDAIYQITTQLLDDERYSSVSMVLGLLRTRLEGLATTRDLVQDLLEFLSDPLRLEALLFQAQKYEHKREGIVSIMVMLDADHVQGVALKKFADPKSNVLHWPTITDILLGVTTAENQGALLDKGYFKIEHGEAYVGRLLTEIRHRTLRPWPCWSGLFEAALKSSNSELQRQALESSRKEWYTPKILKETIAPMFDAQDSQVRKLVLNVLQRLAPETFLEHVKRVVQIQAFEHRPMTEVRFIIKQYLRANPDALDPLYAIIDTRGWFDSTGREVASSCGGLLLSTGDKRAAKIVSARADSFTTHPQLREFYQALCSEYVSVMHSINS